MRVLMFCWYTNYPKLPDWFKHSQEIDLDFEKLQELFNTGLNIMLYHGKEKNILFVDDKRFSQR